MWRGSLAAAAALAVAMGLGAAQAASLPQTCDAPDPVASANAASQARWLALAARLKAELQASGQAVALVSRAGLDLSLIGQRYSHAGLALRDNPMGAWQVRQLYYACDQGRPRLFDQGLAAFVAGMSASDNSYLSVVVLPGAAGQALADAALDNALGHRLLAGAYSANAYPGSTRYQNCNQWVAELSAVAWGASAATAAPAAPPSATTLTADEGLRQSAQRWLQQQGYQGTRLDIGLPWIWLGAFIPWVRDDDHPRTDLAAHRYHVSLPPALEALWRQQEPRAQRLELCWRDQGPALLRRNGPPFSATCEAAADDERWPLDD